jgi:hypothetical protein
MCRESRTRGRDVPMGHGVMGSWAVARHAPGRRCHTVARLPGGGAWTGDAAMHHGCLGRLGVDPHGVDHEGLEEGAHQRFRTSDGRDRGATARQPVDPESQHGVRPARGPPDGAAEGLQGGRSRRESAAGPGRARRSTAAPACRDTAGPSSGPASLQCPRWQPRERSRTSPRSLNDIERIRSVTILPAPE